MEDFSLRQEKGYGEAAESNLLVLCPDVKLANF